MNPSTTRIRLTERVEALLIELSYAKADLVDKDFVANCQSGPQMLRQAASKLQAAIQSVELLMAILDGSGHRIANAMSPAERLYPDEFAA